MVPNDINSSDEQQVILEAFKEHFNTLIEDMIGTDNFLGKSPDGEDYANGLIIKNVYYGGGTLFFDTNKSVLLGLNISNSTILIQQIGVTGKGQQFLMPLKVLWMAFQIYLTTKGKTAYYTNCYNNSEIRHLYDDNMNRHVSNLKFDYVPSIDYNLN